MFNTSLCSFLAQSTVSFTSVYITGIVYQLIIAAVVGGIAFFKIFEKAGQPKMAAFIPFYNYAIAFKVAGKNPALALLMVAGVLVPFVGFVFAIIGFVLLGIAMAKVFGKGGGFVVGLILLWPIFHAILGFGSAQYLGANAAAQGFPVGAPRE